MKSVTLLVIEMALRDLVDDWRIALGAAIGVAAILCPLLVLAGMKDNYVETLRSELTRYPATRELFLLGQPHVNWALVAELRARADVAFAAPRTRFLSASALIGVPDRQGAVIDLAPSGPGDPLAAMIDIAAPSRGNLILSAAAARAIGAEAGSQVVVEIDRVADQTQQSDMRPMRVAGVLPEGATPRRIALVDEAFLTAAEIYRETPEAENLAAAEARLDMQSRAYSGLRLYSRSVEHVASLHDALTAKGFDVESRRAEIDLVQRIANGLRDAFALIGVTAALGGLCALATLVWVMVDRKRQEIAALRLMGVPFGALCGFPACQAMVIAIAGWIISVSAALAIAYLLQPFLLALPALGERGVAPGQTAMLGALGFVSLLSLVAASAGVAAAARIGPAEGLRDV